MKTRTIKHPCPYCGKKVVAREIWEHLQVCPKNNRDPDEYIDELERGLDEEERGKMI